MNACTMTLASVLLLSTSFQDDERKPPKYETPEAAVAGMEAAAKHGDLDALTDSLVESQGKPMSLWMKNCDTLAEKLRAFRMVAKEKLSEVPQGVPDPGEFSSKKEMGKFMRKLEIVEKSEPAEGKAVKLKVKITSEAPDGQTIAHEEVMTAEKADDAKGWRIRVEDLDEDKADFAEANKLLETLAKHVGEVTERIESGKLTTTKEVREALEKDLPRTLPGNVALPPFLSRPGGAPKVDR